MKKLKKHAKENRAGNLWIWTCLFSKITKLIWVFNSFLFLHCCLHVALEVDPPANIVEVNCDDKEDENDGGDSQHETTEEEPDFSSDGTYEPDTENDTASEQEDDANFLGNRLILCTCPFSLYQMILIL